MQCYFDVVQTPTGDAIVGALVSVFISGTTTLATLYVDNGVTPQANPVTTNADGEYAFYAANGTYTLQITATNYATETKPGVVLFDPSDSSASSDVQFLQAGTGAQVRSVQSKLRDVVSVRDFGAKGDGATNDAPLFAIAAASSSYLIVPPGTYLLPYTPAATTATVWYLMPGTSFTGAGKLLGTVINVGKNHGGQWPQNIAPQQTGIYDYLETAASFSALADFGIALSGLARSSQGGGTLGEAHIGVSAMTYNDFVGGSSGTWGFYSTNVRLSTATGPTQGMEIDVANLGAAQQIFPSQLPFTNLTVALWLATGGEITEVAGNTAGSVSAAIGIVRNDAQNRTTCNFEKGIVFDSRALEGTTGTSGAGIAIAFSSCHYMNWYNTSNNLTSSIGSEVQTAANGQRMAFTDSGILFSDVVGNTVQFQIYTTANSANRLAVSSVVAGQSPSVSAAGSDTNIDIALFPKGTGLVKYGTYTSTGDVACNGYIEIKDAAGNVRKLMTTA
jgi:hypothetical protein